jgi:glucose/arabinose dehydrogenase
MNFKLIVAVLAIAAMPVCAQAQAQAPQAPPPPQTPKASQAPKAPKASPTPKAPKAVKDSKDSKEMTKLAVAQKVVKTISGDNAKTQTYCDIGKLGDQIQEAEKKGDMNKIDELNSKMGGLATKLGPEYAELMSGLEDIDPNSKEALEIGSALEILDKLCAK